MSYMLLIIEQPGERDVPPVEGKRRFDVMQAFASDMAAKGKVGAAQSLTTSDRAVRIRHRPAGNSMIDGPFAEAKEIVGGYLLLTVDTWEEAVAIADICPAAEWSIVEVRQFGPCFEPQTAENAEAFVETRAYGSS